MNANKCRYTSRIEIINLIKELHPHCPKQNKTKQNKIKCTELSSLPPNKKAKNKNLRIEKTKKKTTKR